MNTALRAEEAKAIIFISEAHEKFYYENLVVFFEMESNHMNIKLTK